MRPFSLRPRPGPQGPAPRARVLVLTAGVGGGHEAIGRTVGAELTAAGYEVESRDGLRAMGPGLNWALTTGYRNQARHMPAALGAIFAVTSHPAGAAAVRRAVGALHARRLGRLVREVGPDVVISTYPLVTAALGRLRRRGSLTAPALAVIPDYGVHPLWVVPGLDLHLVASPESARLAVAAGGRALPVRMPVAAGFGDAPDRGVARASLGIPGDAFVALLVGGVWGIGDLEGAAACALDAGAYTVVVTGENAQLKRRLRRRFADEHGARILGWRDDMPALMAAADRLVQNAGGMTCLEAIEVGLPIVLFDPIRGHGELNAEVMEREGVARVARTRGELRRLLNAEVRQEDPVGRREKGGAEIPALLPALLRAGRLTGAPTRRSVLLRPALACAALVALISWTLFASSATTVGARALGLDVVGLRVPEDGSALAVRVTDPETAAAVQRLAETRRVPLAIFATEAAAPGLEPADNLSFGVAEDSSNPMPTSLRGRREARVAASAIADATGITPRHFLPARRANLAALAEAPSGTSLVMAGPPPTGDRRAGVVMVDASGAGVSEARKEVDDALEELRGAGLECVSLVRP